MITFALTQNLFTTCDYFYISPLLFGQPYFLVTKTTPWRALIVEIVHLRPAPVVHQSESKGDLWTPWDVPQTHGMPWDSMRFQGSYRDGDVVYYMDGIPLGLLNRGLFLETPWDLLPKHTLNFKQLMQHIRKALAARASFCS